MTIHNEWNYQQRLNLLYDRWQNEQEDKMTINDYDYHYRHQLTTTAIEPLPRLPDPTFIEALTQLPSYVSNLLSQSNSLSSGILLNEASIIAHLPADGIDQELLKLIINYLKFKAEKSKTKENL